jgi:broad specificity phosphatase PhoE
MTRIYLVRHGMTEWNKEEIFRGRFDCKLNETGLAEARALEGYFRDILIESVYSSPLSRATDTAQAIAVSKGLKVAPDPAFVEIDYGEWQGLPLKEVERKYADTYRLWLERPHEVTFPKGENLTRVRTRAWEGFKRVVRENPGKTVLVVSHRGVAKVLICAALGMDNSHFWQIKQDTGAVNSIECEGKTFVVSLVNDTCHMKGIHFGVSRKDF